MLAGAVMGMREVELQTGSGAPLGWASGALAEAAWLPSHPDTLRSDVRATEFTASLTGGSIGALLGALRPLISSFMPTSSLSS